MEIFFSYIDYALFSLSSNAETANTCDVSNTGNPPPTLANAYVTPVSQVSENESVPYTCELGYEFNCSTGYYTTCSSTSSGNNNYDAWLGSCGCTGVRSIDYELLSVGCWVAELVQAETRTL